MYAGLAFQPSQYSGLHYGAPPKAGYPCIKKGADDRLSGGAVSAVQKELRYQLQMDLFEDGFGPETDAAVRQFQTDNKLTVDGIVGPVTGKKLGLEFQNCTAKIETTAAPVDTGGGEPGFFKKIDIFRQTDPGLFYGGIAMTGLVLFAGTAIFLNESGRIPSTAAPKKRKSKKRRKSRKGRRK